MGPSFSDADDEILVMEMANQPSLWQLSHASYKNQRLKDNIWTEIANKLNKPIDDCKKRWRNIKDTYDRKRNKKTGSANIPTRKGKRWALEEKLSFLKSTVEFRGTFSSLNMLQEEEEPELDEEQMRLTEMLIPTQTLTTNPILSLPILSQGNSSDYPTATHRGKKLNISETSLDNIENMENGRKKMKTLHVEETEDDVDLFFKSLAKSVKKLTPPLQQRAKVETLNIITKLETEMWATTKFSSFNFPSSQNFCCNTSTNVLPNTDTDS